MRPSTAFGGARAPRHTAILPSPSGPSELDSLGRLVLGVVASAFVAAILPWLPNGPSRASAGEGALLVATVMASGVVLRMARRRGAWLGTKLVAVGFAVAGPN